MKLSTKLLAGVALLSFTALFFSPKFAKIRLDAAMKPANSGELHSHRYEFKDFNKIRVNGSWRIQIKRADSFSVVTKSPMQENASMESASLHLKAPFQKKGVFEATITMPYIDKIEFGPPVILSSSQGLGFTWDENPLDSASRQDLTLIGFHADSMTLAAGTGFGQIRGENCSFNDLVLRAYGNTKVDLRTCPAKNVDVETSSWSQVHVLVNGGTLTAGVYGSSVLYYHGKADKEQVRIAHPGRMVAVDSLKVNKE